MGRVRDYLNSLRPEQLRALEELGLISFDRTTENSGSAGRLVAVSNFDPQLAEAVRHSGLVPDSPVTSREHDQDSTSAARPLAGDGSRADAPATGGDGTVLDDGATGQSGERTPQGFDVGFDAAAVARLGGMDGVRRLYEAMRSLAPELGERGALRGLSADQQTRLARLQAASRIFVRMGERNAVQMELSDRRQQLRDYEQRALAAAQDRSSGMVDRPGGVPAGTDVTDHLRRQVAVLESRLADLGRDIEPSLRQEGFADESDVIRSLEEGFASLWRERGGQVANSVLNAARSTVITEHHRYRDPGQLSGLRVMDTRVRDAVERRANIEGRQLRLQQEAGRLNYRLETLRSLPGRSNTEEARTLERRLAETQGQLRSFDSDLSQARRAEESMRREARTAFPILGHPDWRPGEYADAASPDAAQGIIDRRAAEILENIERTRANITDGTLPLRNLRTVVALTAGELGVPGNPGLEYALGQLQQCERDTEGLSIHLVSLAIDLAVASCTAGAAGLILGSVGPIALLAADGNADHAERAASLVSLRPEEADLSTGEPGVGWLVAGVADLALGGLMGVRAMRSGAQAAAAGREAASAYHQLPPALPRSGAVARNAMASEGLGSHVLRASQGRRVADEARHADQAAEVAEGAVARRAGTHGDDGGGHGGSNSVGGSADNPRGGGGGDGPPGGGDGPPPPGPPDIPRVSLDEGTVAMNRGREATDPVAALELAARFHRDERDRFVAVFRNTETDARVVIHGNRQGAGLELARSNWEDDLIPRALRGQGDWVEEARFVPQQGTGGPYRVEFRSGNDSVTADVPQLTREALAGADTTRRAADTARRVLEATAQLPGIDLTTPEGNRQYLRTVAGLLDQRLSQEQAAAVSAPLENHPVLTVVRDLFEEVDAGRGVGAVPRLVARLNEFQRLTGLTWRWAPGARGATLNHPGLEGVLAINPELRRDPTELLREVLHDLNAYMTGGRFGQGSPSLTNIPTSDSARHLGRALDHALVRRVPIRQAIDDMATLGVAGRETPRPSERTEILQMIRTIRRAARSTAVGGTAETTANAGRNAAMGNRPASGSGSAADAVRPGRPAESTAGTGAVEGMGSTRPGGPAGAGAGPSDSVTPGQATTERRGPSERLADHHWPRPSLPRSDRSTPASTRRSVQGHEGPMHAGDPLSPRPPLPDGQTPGEHTPTPSRAPTELPPTEFPPGHLEDPRMPADPRAPHIEYPPPNPQAPRIGPARGSWDAAPHGQPVSSQGHAAAFQAEGASAARGSRPAAPGRGGRPPSDGGGVGRPRSGNAGGGTRPPSGGGGGPGDIPGYGRRAPGDTRNYQGGQSERLTDPTADKRAALAREQARSYIDEVARTNPELARRLENLVDIEARQRLGTRFDVPPELTPENLWSMQQAIREAGNAVRIYDARVAAQLTGPNLEALQRIGIIPNGVRVQTNRSLQSHNSAWAQAGGSSHAPPAFSTSRGVLHRLEPLDGRQAPPNLWRTPIDAPRGGGRLPDSGPPGGVPPATPGIEVPGTQQSAAEGTGDMSGASPSRRTAARDVQTQNDVGRAPAREIDVTAALRAESDLRTPEGNAQFMRLMQPLWERELPAEAAGELGQRLIDGHPVMRGMQAVMTELRRPGHLTVADHARIRATVRGLQDQFRELTGRRSVIRDMGGVLDSEGNYVYAKHYLKALHDAGVDAETLEVARGNLVRVNVDNGRPVGGVTLNHPDMPGHFAIDEALLHDTHLYAREVAHDMAASLVGGDTGQKIPYVLGREGHLVRWIDRAMWDGVSVRSLLFPADTARVRLPPPPRSPRR